MIFVAIGANLPAADGSTPACICRRAAAALDGLAGLRLTALSRWYATAPVPPSAQPNFVNGVAALDGTAAPHALLDALHGIEAAFGRVRGVPNAARTLDLDIVAMGGLVLDTTDLILPHPRMHERRFVLEPLFDLAPDWAHPVLGMTVRTLLANVAGQATHGLARTTAPS